ncbi:lactonase [Nocardioides luteus]|uniref:Lipoprotein n=1 Tax=Nocardioides luteus TaxID=1844 RepID=A0ABQ5SRS7_9ACTN|nr:SMP-30/gluconolactonase/LRE family protein [Nocardioides luteus]MDR7313198.1 lactonase [Nocardioides luteus]GGR43384.1 lipoprotein [Nocardioides luteus]GLJ66263.1 lipoprotein [Nocardioides luteus]
MNRRTSVSAVALAGALVAGLAGPALAAPPGPEEIIASKVVKATSPHAELGMTLLEGPTFGADGDLYFVDVVAPSTAPKVLRLDPASREVSGFYTDESGVYTSAQWSPVDGRLYLTDYQGTIRSVAPDGTDPRTVFSGPVEGQTMSPDDLTFDREGNMYLTDLTGYLDPEQEPAGRVIRVEADGSSATVLADELAAPNGISFDRSYSGLYISTLWENRISYLTLDHTRTLVRSTRVVADVDAAEGAETDSNAVDAAGNIYQAIHGEPVIRVFSQQGRPLATVRVPEADRGGLTSATNVAIRPGTKQAYVTVSGDAGGFVYTFDALAPGTRQSNGG